MRSKTSTFTIVALLAATTPALAQLQGPNSSAASYVLPSAPGVITKSILTAGDSVNLKPDGSAYRMVGIPDGTGAYDNGDGTFTMLVNHELGPTSGFVRAHGATGAFVSKWTINKSDLSVVKREDLITSVVATGSTNLSRFCSADLPVQTAFFDASSNLGTSERIFMTGEEFGSEGRAFGTVISTGVAYDLPSLGKFSWENAVASPKAQVKTVVMGMDDSGDGQIHMYVGTKKAAGSVIDQAGLTGGKTFGLRIPGITQESRTTGIGAPSRRFEMADVGVQTNNTGVQLEVALDLAGATGFSRPEDGAFSTINANEFFFVTTDRYDQVKDGVGAQVGRSRLWRMTFDDINNPESGGTMDVLLNGDEAMGNMFDNMTVVAGVDGQTRVLLQEDVGGQDHNGKILLYDVNSDSLLEVAHHNTALFGDIGTPFTLTRDEEASGIIDARDTLGLGWFLSTDQVHMQVGGELVEGGQTFAIFIPQAVPEPTSVALAGGLAGLAAMRRRRA